MNRWHSVYLTGLLPFDVRRDADGRLLATLPGEWAWVPSAVLPPGLADRPHPPTRPG